MNRITYLELVISLVIIIVTSSFTLWILEHTMKYYLFLLQIILVISIVAMFVQSNNLSKNSIAISDAQMSTPKQRRLLDLLFMTLSAILLILNIFSIYNPVNILLAFVVLPLLPGYILLRLTGIFWSKSYMEGFILSYVLGIILSGILPILFIPIFSQINKVALLSVLLVLSVLPIAKDLIMRNKLPKQKVKTSRLQFTHILSLSVVGAFFLFVIGWLYPRMVLILGLDITRHYSYALLWGSSPEYYSAFNYLIFHIYQSFIYSVSTPSLETLAIFAFTSACLFFSFYVMAKQYLLEFDSRFPILATIFFALFSGLGWMYLPIVKLLMPDVSHLDQLNLAYNTTYADIGYGLSANMWLWFLPMTVSFTIFFILLYLLKRADIPRLPYILLTTILVIALYFTHISELVMFILLLSVLTVLGPRCGLRLRETVSSTLIGLVVVYFVILLNPNLVTPSYILLALIGLVGIVFLLELVEWKGLGSKFRSLIMKLLVYTVLFFFVAGLLSWFPQSITFSMAQVGDVFIVPWFFHPIRLGVIGFLGLFGTLVITRKYIDKPVAIFPQLFFAALIAGRAVSVININIAYLGFWEWRFLFFAFAGASVTSTLFLSKITRLATKIKFRKSAGRICLCSLLVSLLVLTGVSSTFLTIERRELLLSEENLLDREEFEGLSFLLSTALNGDPSPLLSVTYKTASALELVPSPWVEKTIQPVLWSSKYPEIPLTFLYNLRFPPPHFFLHRRDFDALTNMGFQDNYISGFLLQRIAEVYTNSQVKIYAAPEGVPPLHNGKLVLVYPSKGVAASDLLASYILSLGGYNYTTRLDLDAKNFESDILIFPSDSLTYADVNTLSLNGNKKLLVINSDGYGSLSRMFFESQGNEVSINVTSGSDVFVYNYSNQTLGTTYVSESLFGGSSDFVVYNDGEKINYLPIVDDDQTGFWTSAGGIGIGTVSAPLLANDFAIGMEGNNSLKILIEEGDYNDWYFQHNYETNQDWSSKEFLSMWYYGINSRQKIGILTSEIDWRHYFQYTFIDDFYGWKRLVIPLKSFSQVGEPNWGEIRKVQMRSFDGGATGTWYLDSICLEDGNNASIEVVLHNATDEVPEISVFNGLFHTPITLPQINSTLAIPANELYFSNGFCASEIFYEEFIGEVRLEKRADRYVITISLKIPPKNSGLSQLRFKVDCKTNEINVTHLIIADTEMSLPWDVEADLLTTSVGVETLGVYANNEEETPLVARHQLGGQMEIFYLNVYPLVQTFFSSDDFPQEFYQIFLNILDFMELPIYDSTIISWVIDDANPVFVFKKGVLEGAASIHTESCIFSEELYLPEICISINGNQLVLEDVISLSVRNIGGEISFSSQNTELVGGRGFYTTTRIHNPDITVSGEQILISALTANGTSLNVEGIATANILVEGSFSALLRNPCIHLVGRASFQEVYALHSYMAELKTLGQNLIFEGTVEFGLRISDEYNIASGFTWEGTFEREPPAYTWNEVRSLIQSIPFFILTAHLFFAVGVFLRKYQVKLANRCFFGQPR